MSEAILVTGATGFTGEHVVRTLLQRVPGSPIHCLVRDTADIAGLPDDPRVILCRGDLRDRASVDAALRGCGALVNVSSLGFDWTDTLMAALAASSIRRAVFVSTTAIFTKLPVRSRPVRMRAEELIRQSRLDWTIVRPTMIYGTPRDRNIARLIRFVRRSPVVPVPAADALQQPVHVEDVAAGVVGAFLEPTTIGHCYTLSGRDALSLELLVRTVVRAVGVRRLVLRLPFGATLRLARLAGALLPRAPITEEQVLRLREDKHFPHDEAARAFGYSPRSFETGVREEVALICGR